MSGELSALSAAVRSLLREGAEAGLPSVDPVAARLAGLP